MATDEGKNLAQSLGFAPETAGAHSYRKGSMSKASTGTTLPPSLLAILDRGKWDLGGILKRYFKREEAGDNYLGRALVFDPNTKEFALLPPHFAPDGVEDEIISLLFPSFVKYPNLQGVLSLCLASVVFHAADLRANLPKKHALFFTPLFTKMGLLNKLTALIQTGFESPHMRATGIPPHVINFQQNDALAQKVEALPVSICAILISEMEKRGAAAANVTPEHLTAIIDGALAPHVKRLGQIEERLVGDNPEPDVAAGPFQAHQRNGVPSFFPASFVKMPVVGVATAWSLWHEGIPADGVPPLRFLKPHDWPSRHDSRKRLSDWKFIMGELSGSLEAYDATALGEGHEKERRRLLRAALDALPHLPSKRKRRPDDWTILTAVKELRKAKKARLEHDADVASSASSSSEEDAD